MLIYILKILDFKSCTHFNNVCIYCMNTHKIVLEKKIKNKMCVYIYIYTYIF